MTCVKKLSKEDLEEFRKSLEEFSDAAIKFTQSSIQHIHSGSLGARVIFNTQWSELAQKVKLANSINDMQISQFEQLQPLSDEEQRIYLQRYAMAAAMAQATLNMTSGVNELD